MRDGLNSSIEPNLRGASGGKGLPPRTHAIHTILYRAYPAGLLLEEVERQLMAWGYVLATANVTRNHLTGLCTGWTKENIIAASFDEGTRRYTLTTEGRSRLASGVFSSALPAPGQQAKVTAKKRLAP